MSDHADDRMRELGIEVRRRRDELSLTQGELADLANCSERFIHTVEHAKPSLRLDKLLDVLGVLGLELQVRPGRGAISRPRTPDRRSSASEPS